MNTIGLILCYGCIYGMANWWYQNTASGKSFVRFCQTWRADGWVHGCLCAGTVYIFGVAAILALGLTFRILGL